MTTASRTSLHPDTFRTRTSLLKDSTLTIGRGGAEVQKTIDPDKAKLSVEDADVYREGSVRAIPLRTGTSDVVVTGETRRGKLEGFAAQLAHYAKHGGELSVKSGAKTYSGTVREANAGAVTLETKDGEFRQIGLLGKSVKFGACTPAFVERKSPSIDFELGNVEGKDALVLRAGVDVSAQVSYRITIADASAQHGIKAELQPMISVSNNTGRDLDEMSLELKLNEPQPQSMARSRGMGLESAMSFSADVGEVSESSAGILTMPVFAKSFGVEAGETRTSPFAAALNGTPNANMAFVPTTLDQKLELSLYAPFSAEANKASGSPSSRFVMSGTPEHQPAGRYQIFDGADLAGELTTSSYTPKGKELSIRGQPMKNITGELETQVANLVEGEWKKEASSGPMIPVAGRARNPNVNETRSVSAEASATIELKSTSKHARDVELSIPVSLASEGFELKAVKNLKVTAADGSAVDAKFEKDGGAIRLTAAVPADGAAKLSIRFDLEGTGHRSVPVEG